MWPQLWNNRAEYSNPLYKAELSQTQGVLRPNTSPYCFKSVTALFTVSKLMLLMKMKWQHCSGSLSQYVFHHFCLNQQFVFFNISQLNCVCSCVYFLHMCYNDTPSVKQCKKTTIKNLTLSFPLLQNVERSVSPHGEIRVFATVPCGLPACCEGEVAAVRGGDDQSPGGTSRRNHQTPPPTTGPQTRHTKHKHTRWQTKSKSIILMFTLQLKRIQCSLEKRKEKKERTSS